MKIYNMKRVFSVLACVCFVQFVCVLWTYGEENIRTDVPSPTEGIVNNENHDDNVSGKANSGSDLEASSDSLKQEETNELETEQNKSMIEESNSTTEENMEPIDNNDKEKMEASQEEVNEVMEENSSSDTDANETSITGFWDNVKICLNNLNERINGFFNTNKKASSNDSSVRENYRGLKMPLTQKVEEPPFHKKYSNKTLTELLYEATLIMKELNAVYHKEHTVDTKPYIDRLNEIYPYLDKKAEPDRRLYFNLLIGLDDRLKLFALQDILTRPYIEMNYKTTKEDLERMFKEVNEKYHGYYVIGYSSSKAGHPITLEFRKFPKVDIVEAHLNAANAKKTCDGVECGEYAFCYMIDNLPQCKCMEGYIQVSKNLSSPLVCKRLTPVDCRVMYGGCSKDSYCSPFEEDFTCTCKSGYLGDGIKCTNKYYAGPICHLELFKMNPYEM